MDVSLNLGVSEGLRARKPTRGANATALAKNATPLSKRISNYFLEVQRVGQIPEV